MFCYSQNIQYIRFHNISKQTKLISHRSLVTKISTVVEPEARARSDRFNLIKFYLISLRLEKDWKQIPHNGLGLGHAGTFWLPPKN